MKLDNARRLMIDSYQHSAERVTQALNGQLVIANSREPGSPVSFGGYVVGLCGQGGRHSYFRVAVTDLRAALDGIARLGRLGRGGSPRDLEAAVDELLDISQRLRSQTIFDSATGCVNDQLPAIVPVLPPEEIWLDGKELPLDVWRLLSCEIDYLSSSLSAHVPLEDIAFGSLTQSGLEFRAMMSRMEKMQLEIVIKGRDLPSGFPFLHVPINQTLSVSLARLLFEAGCLLTPLRQDDIGRWYAALRYQGWIAKTPPRLCVRDEFGGDSVDSRYRGLFAEEMAVGIMAVVLADIFSAKPIVNTVEFLATTDPSLRNKKGPIADFVAMASDPVSSQGLTIIAESKGSLGRVVTDERIRHAKQQVAATRARVRRFPNKLPVAFCSSVFFAHQSQDALCVVVDPPADPDDGEDLLLEPVSAWRVAYSKALRFVGLDSAARQALIGEPVKALHPMYDDRDRPSDERPRDDLRRRRVMMARERFGAELLLDVGPCTVGIDRQVLSVLQRSGISEESDRALWELADKRSRDTERLAGGSFLNYLGLGCIFDDAL